MAPRDMACDFRLWRDDRRSLGVEIHDDDRVAYAFLLDAAGRIVGDVWLYNRCITPDRPDWTRGPEHMPFANPADYADPRASRYAHPITGPADLSVDWGEGAEPQVLLFLRGKLFAILAPGAKPGWSRLARRDGPLARCLPRVQ